MLLCGHPPLILRRAQHERPHPGMNSRSGSGMTGEGGCGWGMNNVLGVRAIDQSPLQRGMDSRLGALSAYLRRNNWVTGHDGWRRQVSGQVLDPSRGLGMTQSKADSSGAQHERPFLGMDSRSGSGMTGEGGYGWGMNNVLGVRVIDQSPLQRGWIHASAHAIGALSAWPPQ